MIYRVTIFKQIGRTFDKLIQQFWVSINMHSEDKNLKKKILEGVSRLDDKGVCIYDKALDNQGSIHVEIIPFPEYPETAESDLLDLDSINDNAFADFNKLECEYNSLEKEIRTLDEQKTALDKKMKSLLQKKKRNG